MSPACPHPVAFGFWPQTARTQSGGSYSGGVPDRTSAAAPSILGGIGPRPRDIGTLAHCRPHIEPRSLLLRLGAYANAVPKDRRRSAGRRCKAAVKSPSLEAYLSPSPTIPHPRVRRPSAIS